MNQKTDMREALQLCIDAMLHDGVPTDPYHPRRIALNAAEAALASRPDAQADERELLNAWYEASAARKILVSDEVYRIVTETAALLFRAAAPKYDERGAFQSRVQPWMLACFGAAIAADAVERNHRFFEEAAELVQACGMTASEAHQLVEYTWSRPIGEKTQEVGGVMVTLAALCLANGLDMHAAGETELARISAPETMAKIRAKQAAKPKHSPLPEVRATAPQAEAAQVVADGRKLVPLEPTEAMLTAGRCVKGLNRKYAAMVAAAPSPDREQVESTRRVDELSMLIRQLVHALRKAAPDNDLAGRAVDYLKRAGLQGSPLRVEAQDASPSRECGEQANLQDCGCEYGKPRCPKNCRLVAILAESVSTQQDCPHGVDDGACKQCYGEAVRGEQGAANDQNSAKHRYFVYDPEGNGFDLYDTDAQREAAHLAAIAEARQAAMDDGEWALDVERIVSGFVTHTTVAAEMDGGGCDYAPLSAFNASAPTLGEAIYQHDQGDGFWKDVPYAEWQLLGAKWRRIVYTTPASAPALSGGDGEVAVRAKTVHRRIDALCEAANTAGADYFDASTSMLIAASISMLIATRDLLTALGFPHRMVAPQPQAAEPKGLKEIAASFVDWELVERMRSAEEIDSEEAGMLGAMIDSQAREIEALRAILSKGA